MILASIPSPAQGVWHLGPIPIRAYHPTFLYESLWRVGVFFLLIWAEKRFHLGHGRLFAPYVAGYTMGRVWIEALRVDHANRVLGLRLNVWTSIIIFAVAVAFLVLGRRGQPAPLAGAAPDEPAGSDGERVAGSGERSASG